MSGVKIANINDLKPESKAKHEDYHYTERAFIKRGEAKDLKVSFYEIPPKKSAFPYHYHLKNEEVYYIISGSGVLKTPEGEKIISKGDIVFFSCDKGGAHKLTNASETESLIYIDFDTVNDIDVCIYPDSNKIGVWGKETNILFEKDKDVDYYTGE